MNACLRAAIAISVTAATSLASAEVTFYEHDNFAGRAFTTADPVGDFHWFGFNDRASSVVVTGESWEVCEDAAFRGRCIILRPGQYPSLRAMDMNDRLSSARSVGHGRPGPSPAPGQITFFEHPGFHGRAFNAEGEVPYFGSFGFNDRASSVVVLGTPWEACDRPRFDGHCVILRPGRYPDLRSMGLDDSVSSARIVPPTVRVEDRRFAPPPAPAYDWRRRPDERFHEADVVSVRGVYNTPQQRCWTERRPVVQERGREPSAGGALIGGILGGILGHQVGNGTGRDIATVGGAVAGAAIGAQAGREVDVLSTRNVQRCESVPPQGRPDYWDVTYQFRGMEHHVQMTSAPGPTVTVNDAGEPRL